MWPGCKKRNPTNKLYKTIEEVIVTVLYRSMTLFSYCGAENGVHKHVLYSLFETFAETTSTGWIKNLRAEIRSQEENSNRFDQNLSIKYDIVSIPIEERDYAWARFQRRLRRSLMHD
jgi:hypothetical protein